MLPASVKAPAGPPKLSREAESKLRKGEGDKGRVAVRGCKDLVGLLADFVEHQLPPGVHASLERHLAACPRCVAQLKTYESTLSLLRTVKDEDLPPELRCTLKAFLDRNCRN